VIPIKTIPSIKDVLNAPIVEATPRVEEVTPSDDPTLSEDVTNVPDGESQVAVDAVRTGDSELESPVAAEKNVASDAADEPLLTVENTPNVPLSDDIEYEEEEDDDEDDDLEDGVSDDGDPDEDEAPVAVNPVAQVEAPPKEDDEFTRCWKQLFETMFKKNHLIYYSLKDEVPRYENDTIFIEVKNNIQKEQFEVNKRAIAEYWRNHFKLNIDDIVIEANEHKEVKKVIINSEDKLNNMIEQNAELPEFLRILKLRIKE
jgi:AAA ATPase containing von Willebrand factor type A (vWA) domain